MVVVSQTTKRRLLWALLDAARELRYAGKIEAAERAADAARRACGPAEREIVRQLDGIGGRRCPDM